MTSINGKYILLTGGSRGIGPLVADALVQRGAHLALAARSEGDLRNVVESLSKYGVKTLAIPVDLAQPGEPARLISTVMDEFGAIDILINNAGVENEAAYTDLTWEAVRETVEVNLLAPMALTRLALPDMLAHGQGHIVNIASVGAKTGAPYSATYYGTKAGLAVWTRGLRMEFAGTGIHFSTIFPGYVTETGLFAKFNITPPWMVGSCTPEQVTRAVVRAIEKEELEVIINSRPARLLATLYEISPAFGDWLMLRLGVVDLQHRKTLRYN